MQINGTVRRGPGGDGPGPGRGRAGLGARPSSSPASSGTCTCSWPRWPPIPRTGRKLKPGDDAGDPGRWSTAARGAHRRPDRPVRDAQRVRRAREPTGPRPRWTWPAPWCAGPSGWWCRSPSSRLAGWPLPQPALGPVVGHGPLGRGRASTCWPGAPAAGAGSRRSMGVLTRAAGAGPRPTVVEDVGALPRSSRRSLMARGPGVGARRRSTSGGSKGRRGCGVSRAGRARPGVVPTSRLHRQGGPDSGLRAGGPEPSAFRWWAWRPVAAGARSGVIGGLAHASVGDPALAAASAAAVVPGRRGSALVCCRPAPSRCAGTRRPQSPRERCSPRTGTTLYRTGDDPRAARTPWSSSPVDPRGRVELEDGAGRGARLAESVGLARDLVNEPPSSLTPEAFADIFVDALCRGRRS